MKPFPASTLPTWSYTELVQHETVLFYHLSTRPSNMMMNPTWSCSTAARISDIHLRTWVSHNVTLSCSKKTVFIDPMIIKHVILAAELLKQRWIQLVCFQLGMLAKLYILQVQSDPDLPGPDIPELRASRGKSGSDCILFIDRSRYWMMFILVNQFIRFIYLRMQLKIKLLLKTHTP